MQDDFIQCCSECSRRKILTLAAYSKCMIRACTCTCNVCLLLQYSSLWWLGSRYRLLGGFIFQNTPSPVQLAGCADDLRICADALACTHQIVMAAFRLAQIYRVRLPHWPQEGCDVAISRRESFHGAGRSPVHALTVSAAHRFQLARHSTRAGARHPDGSGADIKSSRSDRRKLSCLGNSSPI